MSSPAPLLSKRPLEDDDEAPPVKRGRGKPRKHQNATPPMDPNMPKRGRGRPRKDPNAPPQVSKDPTTPSRGRGRPRKDAGVPPSALTAPNTPSRGRGRPKKDAASKASNAPSRGRGRPKKSGATLPLISPASGTTKRGRGRPRKSDAALAMAPHADATPKQGRGRPRKGTTGTIPSGTPQASNTPARGRGRPKKIDGTANGAVTPASAKRTPKSNSIPGPKLGDIIGAYAIDCEEVEGNWPDAAEEMAIDISALPNTASSLIASFNLGIFEGTMLLAAHADTLERVREQMMNADAPGPDKATAPTLEDRTVYFTWRGRETGEGEIHPDTRGTQTGILQFTNDKCTSFKGLGGFPYLGEECAFRGTRVDDEPSGEPEPWSNFSEDAYEEARRNRWG